MRVEATREFIADNWKIGRQERAAVLAEFQKRTFKASVEDAGSARRVQDLCDALSAHGGSIASAPDRQALQIAWIAEPTLTGAHSGIPARRQASCNFAMS